MSCTPLQLHLFEIKCRTWSFLISTFISFMVTFIYAHDLQFLFLLSILSSHSLPSFQLIYTSPSETFFSTISLSLFFTLFFSLHFFLFHLYSFLSQACTLSEKRKLRSFFLTSFLLWYFSLFSSFLFIIPKAFFFFTQFEQSSTLLHITMMAKLSEFQSFFLQTSLFLAFFSQFPIILYFLIKQNILSLSFLFQSRKMFTLLAFLLGAIFTPPDVFSQILLASFLILVYEATLFHTLFWKPYVL